MRMSIKKKILIALIVVLCVTKTVTSVRAETERKTFNAEYAQLENGMDVVVIPNHRAPVVAHMVWYRSGATDEKPGVSGIAHFLEHLMFKGTEKFPGDIFSTTVRNSGGRDNAFTSQDYTAYFQMVSKDLLPKMMEMEADRMKNILLPEETISSEREVIIEERRQRIDNNAPTRFMQETIYPALFGKHPYGTPIIGWREEMEKLSRQDALDFYSQYYAPNNAILVVSGDVTMDELLPLAKKYYGVHPAQDITKPEHPNATPPKKDPYIVHHDPQVGVDNIVKLYLAPTGKGENETHATALQVLCDILTGTSSSRLYKKLIVEEKKALNLSFSYDYDRAEPSALMIYATPAPGTSAEELDKLILKEIEALLADGVTKEELASAKDRMLAEVIYKRDSLMGPAMYIGSAMAAGYDLDYVEYWPSRITNITTKEIAEAIQIVFSPENTPVTGFLLPEKTDAPINK